MRSIAIAEYVYATIDDDEWGKDINDMYFTPLHLTDIFGLVICLSLRVKPLVELRFIARIKFTYLLMPNW